MKMTPRRFNTRRPRQILYSVIEWTLSERHRYMDFHIDEIGPLETL